MSDLGPEFILPSGLVDALAAQAYGEALAGYLATKAASHHFDFRQYTALIRNSCVSSGALRNGSFRLPAL